MGCGGVGGEVVWGGVGGLRWDGMGGLGVSFLWSELGVRLGRVFWGVVEGGGDCSIACDCCFCRINSIMNYRNGENATT